VVAKILLQRERDFQVASPCELTGVWNISAREVVLEFVGTRFKFMVEPAHRAWRMKNMRSTLGTLSLRLMTSRGRLSRLP